jgi:hypothetical protein
MVSTPVDAMKRLARTEHEYLDLMPSEKGEESCETRESIKRGELAMEGATCMTNHTCTNVCMYLHESARTVPECSNNMWLAAFSL